VDAEVFGNRRFNLDGPPPQPEQRSKPSTPESLYDSSSGSVTEEDEDKSTSDHGTESTASAFLYLATAEDALTSLSSMLPELTPICSDCITTLRQQVPQMLAARQSQQPMSNTGTSNTMGQLSGLFGGGGQPKPAPISGPPAMAAPPGGTGGVMG
jgi:hypothetical protein